MDEKVEKALETCFTYTNGLDIPDEDLRPAVEMLLGIYDFELAKMQLVDSILMADESSMEKIKQLANDLPLVFKFTPDF